ncbi:hypothetical protein, partial [Pseudomonas aeruginosa]|uniref:hypothetical protein n=3 Tax=Pseudomonas aeruginosa TaxID=287 RepID=UPI001ED992CD
KDRGAGDLNSHPSSEKLTSVPIGNAKATEYLATSIHSHKLTGILSNPAFFAASVCKKGDRFIFTTLISATAPTLKRSKQIIR